MQRRHSSILLKNVSLAFEGQQVPVLQVCHLSIRPGERVLLCGPSGSGKSSFFRLLMGFLLPQEGEIHLHGQRLCPQTIHSIRQQTAYLPQRLPSLRVPAYAILGELLGFKANQLEARQYKAAFDHYCQQLNISVPQLEQPFFKLSGGEQQRAGIALALSLQRRIILLDEPTAALDAANREKVEALLESLSGPTIIWSAHHPPVSTQWRPLTFPLSTKP